jgi:hypothetical protein
MKSGGSKERLYVYVGLAEKDSRHRTQHRQYPHENAKTSNHKHLRSHDHFSCSYSCASRDFEKPMSQKLSH